MSVGAGVTLLRSPPIRSHRVSGPAAVTRSPRGRGAADHGDAAVLRLRRPGYRLRDVAGAVRLAD